MTALLSDVSIHFGGGWEEAPPGFQQPELFWLWTLLVPWVLITVLWVIKWREIRQTAAQDMRDRLVVMLAAYFFCAAFCIVMTPIVLGIFLCYAVMLAGWGWLFQTKRRAAAFPPGNYVDPRDGQIKWWDGRKWLDGYR